MAKMRVCHDGAFTHAGSKDDTLARLARVTVSGLHMLADTVLALTYILLALVLAFMARRFSGLLKRPYIWLITIAFGLTGAGHLVSIWMVWALHPLVIGAIQLASASVAVTAALLVCLWLPRGLELAQKHRLEPANRVSEAQYKISQMALAQTQDLLKALACTVSHDLRAPIRHISVFASLIQREESDVISPAGRDYLDRIQKASNRMQAQINGFVDYANLLGTPVELTDQNLEQAARAAKAALSDEIAEAGAKVEIEALPMALHDGSQMQRVFEELIKNTLIHSDVDTPIIRISLLKPQQPVSVAVTDNGQGVQLRHSEKIFEILKGFNTQPNPSGEGMGLAICRQIMEKQGGQIHHDADYKNGLRVVLTLHSTASV